MKHLFFLVFLLFACNQSNGQKEKEIYKKNTEINTNSDINITKKSENIKKDSLQFNYELVGEIYHNDNYYTQGYIYHEGHIYESTGQHGESGIFKIDPKTGKTLQEVKLGIRYFGEGLEVYKDKLYFLTWRNQICKIYDLKTLTEVNEFRYVGEGWGLCEINNLFYLSDGSDKIQIKEPNSFTTIDYFSIEDEEGYPLNNLNELEFAKGYIFANVWMTNKIAIIDPDDRKLVKMMDFSELRKKLKNNPDAESFNGIAYDSENDIFYLTGKNWNKSFKVKIF